MRDWRAAISGNHLRWKGAVWTISTNLNGKLHLENFETGETTRLKLTDYIQGCSDGKVEMVESPRADLPDERQALAQLPFSALPPSSAAQVERMRRYIEAFMDPDAFYDQFSPSVEEDERHRPNRMSKAKVDPLLVDVASSFRPHADDKPGFTTFASWMRMWKRYRDWKLMAPLYHLRGSSDRSVIVGPMKRIVDQAIADVWMRKGTSTKEAVCEAVENAVARHNDRTPEASIGVSRRQVYRYMTDEIDRYEEAVARKGKPWADKRFKPKFRGPGADRILQVVEVDHTQAKIEVVDDETGKCLGRPWITVALCRRSRMVVGLHVHFEGPSLNAVMQCLKNVMLPKAFLKKLVPELDYEFSCCGTPESFFFDRGRDFDSDHVREVGLNFDIVIKYAPGDNPELKGSIERLIGTLHAQTSLVMKGAMPRVKDREPDHSRKSEAVMPFSDFVERVWHWLTMVYAKDFHEGLGDSPLSVWNESASVRLPRPPPSKDKVDAYLMRAVRCEPTVQGVRSSGLIWNGDVIKRIRSHPGHRRGGQILVRIDDNDIGRAFATDPVTGSLEPLLPVLDRYMPGTTMHQHELVMRRVKQKQTGAHSERSLMEAKRKMREEAIESLNATATKSRTRARLARMMNIGGAAPAGDDMGALDPKSPAMEAAAPPTARATFREKSRTGNVELGRARIPERLPEPQQRRSGQARRLGS